MVRSVDAKLDSPASIGEVEIGGQGDAAVISRDAVALVSDRLLNVMEPESSAHYGLIDLPETGDCRDQTRQEDRHSVILLPTSDAQWPRAHRVGHPTIRGAQIGE